MALSIEKQLEVLSDPLKIKRIIFKNGGLFDDCHNWISLASGKITGVIKLKNGASSVLFKSECQPINMVIFDADNENLQVSDYSLGQIYYGKLDSDGVDKYNDSIIFDDYKIERFSIIRKNSIDIENLSQEDTNNIIDNYVYSLSISEHEDDKLNCFVHNDFYHDPLSLVTNHLLKEQLEDILNTLTSKEAKVIKLRFGFEDGVPRCLEEVGREFNVSGVRVRQIEAKALRKLRCISRSKQLIDYLK